MCFNGCVLHGFWDKKGGTWGHLSCTLNSVWKFAKHSREERALYAEGECARCKGITEHRGLRELKELDVAGVWAELWWGRRRQERRLIQ